MHENMPIVMVMPSCLQRGCAPLGVAVKSAIESMKDDPDTVKLVSCGGSTTNSTWKLSLKGLERRAEVVCGLETREMPKDHYLRSDINYVDREGPMDDVEEHGAIRLSSSQILEIASRKS